MKRTSAHRNAYNSVKDDLARAQRRKCCYCERIVTRSFNDVEHYRPFSRYWWLAWTWENLLFACATCNRSGKSDEFPLEAGATPLAYDQEPPGDEVPLFVDPGSEDPTMHIDFVRVNGRWRPIGLTARGRATLSALAFDDDYRDDVDLHVESVMERIRAWRMHHDATPNLAPMMATLVAPLLEPSRPFSRLTRAVLREELPGLKLETVSGS